MHRGTQTDLWRWMPAQPQQDLQAAHDLLSGVLHQQSSWKGGLPQMCAARLEMACLLTSQPQTGSGR